MKTKATRADFFKARLLIGFALSSLGILVPLAGFSNSLTGSPTTTVTAAALKGAWTTTGRLLTARFNHTATLLPDGKVLVAGGYGSKLVGRSAELYDPASGTWTETGRLNHGHSRHTATLLADGKVLVAGGVAANDDFQVRAYAELYDPANGTWTETRSLNTGRWAHTATLLPSGKVLVAGGYNFAATGPLASAELYDPPSGTWSTTGSLANQHSDHTATLLPNGKVLVAGGFDIDGPLASAELYDPARESWAATGSLRDTRRNHIATLLPNGTVWSPVVLATPRLPEVQYCTIRRAGLGQPPATSTLAASNLRQRC